MTVNPAFAESQLRDFPRAFVSGSGFFTNRHLSDDQRKFVRLGSERGGQFRERALRAFTRPQTAAARGTVLIEVATHLTGAYPGNWPGRRLPGPLSAWFFSDDPHAAREAALDDLLGRQRLVPRDLVSWAGRRPGSRDTNIVLFNHVSGGVSELLFPKFEFLDYGTAYPVPQPSPYGRPVYADLMAQASMAMGRGIGLVVVHWLGRTEALGEWDHTLAALKFLDPGGDPRPRIANVSDWYAFSDPRPRRY